MSVRIEKVKKWIAKQKTKNERLSMWMLRFARCFKNKYVQFEENMCGDCYDGSVQIVTETVKYRTQVENDSDVTKRACGGGENEQS